MAAGLVLMSGKEADRLGLVRDVVEGPIRQRQAAERLGWGFAKSSAWCAAAGSAARRD